MSMHRLAIAAVFFLAIPIHVSAQTATVGEPVQLTHSVSGTFNMNPLPVWNGREWGVTYLRLYGEGSVHFLSCTAWGAGIGGHQLIGMDKEYDFNPARLCAYEKGWAFTIIKYKRTNNKYDRTGYFYTLNKNGRKTGVEATIFSHQRGSAVQPVPVGSMFVIFYNKITNRGFEGIYIAYIDQNGKRVVPDRQVTDPLGEHHVPQIVVPTSEGFAITGVTAVNYYDYKSAFYMLVGLDGKPIVQLTRISNDGVPIRPHCLLWNGKSFVFAGTENLFYEDDGRAPVSRLLNLNGTWQSMGVRHLPQEQNYHYGLGYDGNRYLALIGNRLNATIWCQELDNNLRPIGSKMTVDDGSRVDYQSRVGCAGSLSGFFSVLWKSLGGDTYNIYYSSIQLPHDSKPNIAYFNGKVHEFNGKSYVLLDWLASGCESVKMKTKGGRWTLPATGFHAVEIEKKSKYKIIASNFSGSSKAKVKIAP